MPILRLSSIALTAAACMLVLVGCAAETPMTSKPAVPLEGTYWKLVEAGGKTPGDVPRAREPHMLIDAGQQRVTGSGGVNRFTGGFQASGTSLSFSAVASTRMAGPPPLMELEDAYFKALGATAARRISGDTLELLDAGGKTVARFRASTAP
jgi:heat shock protein HslJ